MRIKNKEINVMMLVFAVLTGLCALALAGLIGHYLISSAEVQAATPVDTVLKGGSNLIFSSVLCYMCAIEIVRS